MEFGASPPLTYAATLAKSSSKPSLSSWNHLATLFAAVLPVSVCILIARRATAASATTYAASEISGRSYSPRPPSLVGSFAHCHCHTATATVFVSSVPSLASDTILSSSLLTMLPWSLSADSTMCGATMRHKCIGTVLLQYLSNTNSSCVSWMRFRWAIGAMSSLTLSAAMACS